LVPSLDYTAGAIEPPIQALGASGASLMMCVAWCCLDGTQHSSYWPILAVSDQSPASIWSVVDNRGPN